MKQILLLGLLLIQFSGIAQNWQQLTDFPGNPRDDGSGFIIGDTAYFGTGMTPWWSCESDFYGLNLSNDSWFPIAALPVNKERQYASGFSNELTKGYVFGGYNGTQFLNDLWEYNAATNSWMELNSLSGVGRSGCAHFVMNDTVYIMGGKTAQNTVINEVWAYSFNSNSWTQKNSFPFENLWRSTATSKNGKGYLIFGRDENNYFHNELYEYDPAQDSWIQISSFPSLGRSHASISVIDDALIVCFGLDSLNNSHNDLWKYQVDQNIWTNYPGLPASGRRGGIGLAHQNVLYYVTGINEANERLVQTWKFNPVLSTPVLSPNQKIELLKIVDIFGREVPNESNQLLIFIYSDGSSKKVFQVE